MNQINLPNAVVVLILGILSIVTCCCYGILGIIFAVIGLLLYSKDNKLYVQNPEMYSNYSTLSTGRILCIIGLILSILAVMYFAFVISIVGWDALTDQDLLYERLREMGVDVEN